MRCTPAEVKKALSFERVGGAAFINICADGETLFTKNIDQYVKVLLENGHYVELVTNMTATAVIDKILTLDKVLLSRLEFKCSFHYLELLKHNLLDIFAENVNKVWKAGASATVEITPTDELIPLIPDVKSFSAAHFGALPHITVARDEGTKEIDNLTNLPDREYDRVWSQFKSSFWEYKREIFGVRQKKFCYAGAWSFYINLATGDAKNCYQGRRIGNIFNDFEKPLPWQPIGLCPTAHCFNGHALLTLGLIPYSTRVGYGDIRNRVRGDGTEWLQPEFKAFLNTRLWDSNELLPAVTRQRYRLKTKMILVRRSLVRLYTGKPHAHKKSKK